ncbi:beta-1,4 N-acetylgalactosaminyltransferase 2-like protein [Labeo rohita]|uniref:Beta-1,4 N-acetylgalactosaminyltransferase 2-like protein n=1 Tax=Labeo rohita TaxID=84645 RepID=A0A498MNE1_LABRO|nr:beta-1,4 N-acetylgalactosaminyltransferase 2-like protein [Labeo rohita]
MSQKDCCHQVLKIGLMGDFFFLFLFFFCSTRRVQFSKGRPPNRNIGPFPSKNRSSCSCEGYALNAKHVAVDELEDLQRRRSEEYRQYQLRMGTKMESLILAQSNSPLQYPIQGFVVEPLTKSVIPVNFSFEEYEAIFSIEIKRPSVPVLYDPGEDINSQVTIATKTFLRYDELNILIKSIRQFYPEIKIIIADDSLEPQNVTGYKLEQYIMPPTQGWFAGRNLAVSQVTTKYFLWVDDDYIFSNSTRIEKFVEIMEKVPELDVATGEKNPGMPYPGLACLHAYVTTGKSHGLQEIYPGVSTSHHVIFVKPKMGANLDKFIIAPANSPLQYPITGFTVSPLKKSVIPGLALQTQKREVYKVSLSAKTGVLSVDSVTAGDQVDGQGQSNLTISSSSLTHVNDLLSRVTYYSTIYHIKTSDFVHFIFEDHEVVFPILIRRQTVPSLYDPGTDVNSQVTVLTKTFLRYKELNVLIQSIRMYYPDIMIIIADDSMKPEPVTGKNIEHYIMPPTRGWFAGRNLAVSQVTTKYFLWVDDDFQFLKGTRIESFVEIMEAVPELDIVSLVVTFQAISIISHLSTKREMKRKAAA